LSTGFGHESLPQVRRAPRRRSQIDDAAHAAGDAAGFPKRIRTSLPTMPK
jgi:hypothetical protein